MVKEFKSESKQLLNLMIHSIYSNKDIFLRELISNASDALDKRHFYEIQNKKFELESKIEILIDKENRKIMLTDTGIGMTLEEIESNLGTIAHSGSAEFMSQLEDQDTQDLDIIGQFGVGFYSSFIVSDKVEVVTKKIGQDDAYIFISEGIDTYSVEKTECDNFGTTITLSIKSGEEFDKFLEDHELKSLVKKHNDYVKYPIFMEEEIEVESETEEVEGQESPKVTAIEKKIVNSQKAIWKKAKKDVTTEEYNEFYSSKYYDFTAPLKVIHSKAEGTQSLDILLFIPSKKSYDYYTPNFKKGLDLYSKGILIDHSVEYLLPNHFSFVKGLIDSEDISLNVSREMLQQDKTVDKIKKSISNKIKRELLKLQSKKRDDYNAFYDEFSRTLMYGVYEEFGANKEELKDLIMFKTSREEKYVTLKEYVANNEEKVIYYASGSSIEQIKQMPVMESALKKDIEILYLVNDVDEFAIQMMQKYDEHEFKSIVTADLSSEEEKEELTKINEENKDLLEKLKSSLNDQVSDVKITNKLENSAVCLVNDNDISIEQEKILMQMPDSNFSANKILQINPNHELFKALNKSYLEDNINLEDISTLLYNQALLIEGLELKDPTKHAELLNKLIISTLK